MTDEERIAWYRQQRDKALKLVRDIREGGWRYHETRNNAPYSDVTEQYCAKQEAMADHLEQLAKAWELLATRS